jgi:tRNA-specific adenosine deaminase 3
MIEAAPAGEAQVPVAEDESSRGKDTVLKLVELLPPEYTRAVSLITFHAAVVPKALGDRLLKLLQSKCPFGPDLIHLKRVRAAPSSEPKGSLEVLLCPKNSQPPPEVSEFLLAGGCSDWHPVDVPEHGALTRAQLVDFSQHWPLTYRKPSLEPLDLSDAAKQRYAQLLRRAEEVGMDRCGCVIVDRDGRELAAVGDHASEEYPLRHAVMAAIDVVAASHAAEAARPGMKRPHVDDDYLCCNCEAIMTHEPCLMCAMALVHSRVRLVAYRYPDPEFGGFGGKLSLHTCASLNHLVRVLRFS